MSNFSLIWASLKARSLSVILSVALTAFGVMLAMIVLQFGNHVKERLHTDGQGVDIVIGAKGSPLQLILSSLYHIDIPTGNIPWKTAENWMKHPQVKTAIPLALGDNWQGHRIVGTTPDYIAHYNAQLIEGKIWSEAFEAIVGVDTGLTLDDHFVGAHGLLKGGHVHEEEKYRVVGVMKSTGTVLDRLILTSLDSVLMIHGQKSVEHDDLHGHGAHEEHDHHDHEDHHESHKEHEGHNHDTEHGASNTEPEITALLVITKTPLANINLVGAVNRQSALQAANPAVEMARLTSMLGLGAKTFFYLSMLLIIIAALNIFAGLAGSLENRMGDFAVLRALGYTKGRIATIIMGEATIITILGIILGVLAGMIAFGLMSSALPSLSASGAQTYFGQDSLLVIVIVLCAGLFAALVPALKASRVDIAQQLSMQQ